jgi:hypothetical protein
MKPNYKDNLFPFLNWILKKNSVQPDENDIPSIFITNRWLSMIDPSLAQIVNVTFNRWIYKTLISKENLLAGKIYRTLLPRIGKKINYIKRSTQTNKTDEVDNIETLANNMEISVRELHIYNSALEHLNKK